MTQVKCGWRACETQIEPVLSGGAIRQYCSDGHKQKASAARSRSVKHSRAEFRKNRIWNASAFTFAKMMETSERMAYAFGWDPAEVKTEMVDAVSRRIATYRAELDA